MYKISLFDGGPAFTHTPSRSLAGTGQRCTCPLSGCAKEIYDPKTGRPDPAKLAAWNEKNYEAARERDVKGAPMGSYEQVAFEAEMKQKEEEQKAGEMTVSERYAASRRGERSATISTPAWEDLRR